MRILFYRGRGVWSAFIRHFTRAENTHVSIMFDDGVVFEAWPGAGVQKTLLSDWEGVTAYRLIVPVDLDGMRKFCEALAAEKPGYDYAGVLGFVFGMKQRAGRWTNRWFCSEFVFAAVAAGGVSLLDRTEPWEVSPAMLEKSSLLVRDGRDKTA